MKVYILLSQTGTMPSRFFKAITKAPYNHSSISLNKELTDMRSFARRKLHNTFIAGYVYENVYEKVFMMFDNKKINVCVLEIETEKENIDSLRDIFSQFDKNYKKHKYSFFGLFTLLFGSTLKFKGHYFCSEFVAESLQRAGIIELTKAPAFMKPIDFKALSNACVIYEGTLHDYKLQTEENKKTALTV